jgi:hypothetical protein
VNDLRLPTADIIEYILDYLALPEWIHKVIIPRPEGTRNSYSRRLGALVSLRRGFNDRYVSIKSGMQIRWQGYDRLKCGAFFVLKRPLATEKNYILTKESSLPLTSTPIGQEP